MKTAEEFYKEFENSKELQKEWKELSDAALEAFLKEHGCDANAKDFTAFVRARDEGELGDDDVEAIAGGSRIYVPSNMTVKVEVMNLP